MSNVCVTIRKGSTGPRAEDLPGYDPDQAVIHMVNINHAAAVVLEDAREQEPQVWEQLQRVPTQYRKTEERIAGGMLARLLMGVPLLAAVKVDWIPGWIGVAVFLAAAAWAVIYGLQAKEG